MPGKAMVLGKPKKQNELMKDLQKENIYSGSRAFEGDIT